LIACACQGIHQLPLRHLIVLIANTHRAIPKGSSLPRDLEEIVASAKSRRILASARSEGSSLQPNPVQDLP
ncbi:hypothetical protein, partial [Mesorhizobium sp.]|uniref:hypothetical protein n=1 Tax=Mesorhizobium sp. TaxID=1871066 RepID=UPI00338E25A9